MDLVTAFHAATLSKNKKEKEKLVTISQLAD
jgi:hypothetical protein